MRNRTHRVAADLEQKPIAQLGSGPVIDPAAEIVVLTHGAHIRAPCSGVRWPTEAGSERHSGSLKDPDFAAPGGSPMDM